MKTKFKCKKKFTPVPPPRIAQSGPARRPMRGRLEAHLDHVNIRGEAGGDCLGKSIVYMCLLPL